MCTHSRSVFSGLALLVGLTVTTNAQSVSIQQPISLIQNGQQAGTFTTIQDAVDGALSGDTILLPAGVLSGPGNRDVAVSGKDLTIQGAGQGATIIDCEDVARAFFFSGAIVTPLSELSDLTIRNGNASLGGGILIEGGASPSLSNLEIHDCQATAVGGGMYVSLSSTTTADNLYVHNNTGAHGGGGIGFLLPQGVLSGSRIEANISGTAGGGVSISNPLGFDNQPGLRIEDTAFVGNSAALDGGAFYSELADNFFIDRCTFLENNAEGSGGALEIFGDFLITGTDAVFIQNSIIAKNTAFAGAGLNTGLGSVILQNCTVADNEATGPTGGLLVAGDGMFLLNTLVWGNTGTNASVQEQNLDFSGVDAALLLVFFNNIEGGAPDPTSISADPLFCDPDKNDYHIGIASPCINAGLPAFNFVLTQMDIDGQPRIQSNEIDIGADERVADIRPVVTNVGGTQSL